MKPHYYWIGLMLALFFGAAYLIFQVDGIIAKGVGVILGLGALGVLGSGKTFK